MDEYSSKIGPKPADHPSVGLRCPACGDPLAAGDYIKAITLGPGKDPEARELARTGQPYTAVVIEVHWACATGGDDVDGDA